MMKNVSLFLFSILLALLVFECSLDQTDSCSSNTANEEQVQSSGDNTKAVTEKYLVNETTLLRIVHTYYQDFIEVSSLNELQVITKHAVARDAKITLNGKTADLYDLQKGDLLKIYYIADKKKTAKVINAKRVIF